jgi:phosphoribosylamine--glycine ligase
MNILIVGSGGREHALAWKMSQSPQADQVYVAPGNAGTAIDAINVPIDSMDIESLVQFAKDKEIGLTVVGPEAPLVAGIVNAFRKENLRIFGPTAKAAELEGSKVFFKELMRNADIPTAEYQTFSNAEDAITYLQDREDVPIVVKADGLAAGKGVVVASGKEEAIEAVRQIAQEKVFGDAGNQLVIEEKLDGQEASIIAITDGNTILTLDASQDHKPAHDGDTGPNTGGMGAYCPAPLITSEMMTWIEENILVRTIHEMKKEHRPFVGILYAGLMITRQGPKVLEYNVRFGDPECQPLLMRAKSDLVEVFNAAVDGKLDKIGAWEWDDRPSVCVVMASEGYPASYEKGFPIRGIEQADEMDNVKVFHAGTKEQDGEIVNSGGRVLGVTALGDTISNAKLNAYRAVKEIRWQGAWCRKDISDKSLPLVNGEEQPPKPPN